MPLDRANVDTDQIIPKQFLKRIERTGYGDFLFFDWRRPPHGDPDPDFELNDPRYKGAEILVAGKNFGCGSSREHAAWALNDYGFRVVIAPSFADIFFSNAGKNGILLVTLTEEQVAQLLRNAQDHPELSTHRLARRSDRHRRPRLLGDLRSRPLPQVTACSKASTTSA